jgi:hypothetical protein
MKGYLAYQLIDQVESTKLTQRESIFFSFPINLLNSVIKKVLQGKLLERMEEIKAIIM